MKAFTSVTPKDLKDAAAIHMQARASNQSAAFAGGGSDLLGQMKERLVTPDVLISLRSVKGADAIAAGNDVTIGGQTTLDAISKHDVIRRQLTVLAEAAETVATPQIRNVATIAGNVCQRPWCWYYRNGFKCLKNGGTTCFSVAGENQYHAIFGGGPSYIVHPSDTAPALVALDARFRIIGPSGERVVPAAEFFTLPTADPARENVLGPDELLASIAVPRRTTGAKSAYRKVMDREAWTHALVSVAVAFEMEKDVCKSARIVLGGVAPIPWRVPEAEKLIAGKAITPALAKSVGEAAVAGAKPLAKNGYKVEMTRALVTRTLSEM
jgi:xanthine dehydrogenase YagS FAD-binding subunit